MKYPIKLSVKSEIIPVLLIIVCAILSIYFYSHFPDRVVGHWNFEGTPDRYTSKTGAAFGMLGVIAGMYVLFLVLPLLDPKRERYQSFEKVYHYFKGLIISVMSAIYIVSGFYNLGYNLKINLIVPLIIGLLMIAIGNYMGKIKNNWFVGIRTPWTLSSENVWNKTHRMGGWCFMVFGLLIIVSPLLPKALGLAAFIAGIVLVVFGTMVYSYLVYRKEQNTKQIGI